ncbi:MAG TPA: enoyl-CoA hydratase/isomerase family protein [Candidatus Binataceae bacterium]|nr:enoyl-CoA hydratase/isomerase family protein [Candidatus Binataceae bacterium]
MAYSEIIFEKHNAIATITINRPHAMNAGTIRTWGEIADAFRDAEADDAVRVVVITGAGRAFCAGDDVKEIFLNPEFRDAKPNKRKEVEEWRKHEPVALDFLLEYPKPTIASVNGAAVGYGCDIALMCDMRVCSDQAKFGEVFIRRGLIPEAGGLVVLPRLVGLARAYELILTGDIIDATEAERIGMVNRVVPHAQLGEATMALATKLAAQAPLAQRLAKEALRVGLNLNLPHFYDYQRHGQHLMLTSKDHIEGAKSFVEKRPANFKGE